MLRGSSAGIASQRLFIRSAIATNDGNRALTVDTDWKSEATFFCSSTSTSDGMLAETGRKLMRSWSTCSRLASSSLSTPRFADFPIIR